jgi:uncharacterized SAM-binding protein YcdF (DUF218 family)
MRRKRIAKIGKGLIGVVCGVALVFLYCAASIYTYGRRTTGASAQAAIVLGAAVWGQEPSPVFRERINHAIALYQSGKVQKIVFTGGYGKQRHFAESEVARLYALQHGVAAADILTEDRSHTTFENLQYARQAVAPEHLRRFLLVSDPLHMKRAMAMAADMGIDALPSPTPTTRYKTLRSQLGLLMHETYFYVDYRVRHYL